MSVHDGWKPYHANTRCRHSLCNIHHLRELTFLEEQYQQAWATDLKGVLREMKVATDQARLQGATHLPPARARSVRRSLRAPPRDRRGGNPHLHTARGALTNVAA